MKIKPKNLRDLDRGPVNCDNAIEMIAAKLHPPFLNLDRKVFTKTKEEKLELKNEKSKGKLKCIRSSVVTVGAYNAHWNNFRLKSARNA